MALQEYSVIAALLGVTAPWSVTEVRVTDRAARLISVHIDQHEAPGRFWTTRKNAPVEHWLRWAHINMAGVRCEIVLGLRGGQQVPHAGWSGQVDSPFTHGLSRLAMDLLLEGATMDQLCRMLQVPFADLWKFKFRLDQGTTRVAGSATASAAAAPAMVVNKFEAARADEVACLPPQDSPVWLVLLLGRLELDVRTLGLKLLLAKLQREARMHDDADLYAQAAQSLHRYFAKNLSLLAHEVAQLDRASVQLQQRQAAPAPAQAGDDLPDVSDPLWLALLQGERDLDVRTLSLKLLLTKLRAQARSTRDDEVMMLKLVELHRFFGRHQAVLRHEIGQLQRWSVH
jgi:hypothetical protein